MIAPNTAWHEHLYDCDCVIHAAALVHVMNSLGKNEYDAYRTINVEGTLNLARQAASAGVKRFIFISSIKVNGEERARGTRYHADDTPNPSGAYALSKHEAERGLLALSRETGMEVVIIRPPLIYGPGVKGNFKEMIKWLKRGVPLPLSGLNNQRSFVSVYNLSSLIVACIDNPRAANQIFLVSDGGYLSTTELLEKMGAVLSVPVRLIRVPDVMLKSGLKILKKEQISQRLFGSLVLDIQKTKDMLNWEPEDHMDAVLKEMANHD